jgi:hypothetical protein
VWRYPPPPIPGLLESWGYEQIPARSLGLKDLRVKSSRTSNLRDRFASLPAGSARLDASTYCCQRALKRIWGSSDAAVVGGRTSHCSIAVDILARVEWLVCDGAHSIFVMKNPVITTRWRMPRGQRAAIGRRFRLSRAVFFDGYTSDTLRAHLDPGLNRSTPLSPTGGSISVMAITGRL